MIDREKSEPAKVGSSVPQGTILGSLIFLFHINNLPGIVTSITHIFTDDFLLYRIIKTMEDQIAIYTKGFKCSYDMGHEMGNHLQCNILRISRTCEPLPRLYSLAGQLKHMPNTWELP